MTKSWRSGSAASWRTSPRWLKKKLFGGLAFMLGGNICCGVMREELMVRVGSDGYDEALVRPHATPMDFTGRAIKVMVYVSP